VRYLPEPWPGAGLFAICFFTGQMMAPPIDAPLWLRLASVAFGVGLAYGVLRVVRWPSQAHIFNTALDDARGAAIAALDGVKALLARPHDEATRAAMVMALHRLDAEEARIAVFAGLGPAAEGNRRQLRALHDIARALLLAAEVAGFDQVALNLPEDAAWPSAERAELGAVIDALGIRLGHGGRAADWAQQLQAARQAQVERIRPDAPWVMVMVLRVLSALQIVGGATEQIIAPPVRG
jgi:hypothetical protein